MTMAPFDDNQVFEPPAKLPSAAPTPLLALTEIAVLLVLLAAFAAFVYRLLAVLCCGS